MTVNVDKTAEDTAKTLMGLKRCRRCNGSGEVLVPIKDRHGQDHSALDKCWECEGIGWHDLRPYEAMKKLDDGKWVEEYLNPTNRS